MFSKSFLFLFAITLQYCSQIMLFGEMTDDHVLILTTQNFDEVIHKHENILVEFYAPWCGHCQALDPEYKDAARRLMESDSEIRLAKVDATVEKELANTYQISGYPSLKFFQNQTPIDYNGPRKAVGIVDWLLKKTGPAVTMIENDQDLAEFIDTQSLVVLGFFLSEEKAGAFLTAARQFEKIDFGLVLKPDLFISDIGSSPGIILYKNYDEEKVIYDLEIDVENITKFVKIHQHELVSEFSQELSEKFFDGSINKHLIFFAPKNDDATNSIIKTLRTIAKDFRGKVLFITVDSSSDEYQSILEFFAITKDDIPCIRAVILSEEVQRFKQLDTDLNESSMRNFVEKFLNGELIQDLKKQETPQDWNSNPVKVLTGSNFAEVISERKSKKAIVEFYAPWCGHCKALSPIWDQLGEHFKDDDGVIIAKVDSTLNEFVNIPITSFPTIKYFPRNSDAILDYKGTRDLNGFINFIEKDGTPESEIDSEFSDEEKDFHQAHEDL